MHTRAINTNSQGEFTGALPRAVAPPGPLPEAVGSPRGPPRGGGAQRHPPRGGGTLRGPPKAATPPRAFLRGGSDPRAQPETVAPQGPSQGRRRLQGLSIAAAAPSTGPPRGGGAPGAFTRAAVTPKDLSGAATP
ncbi:basic salivary proline-rich protein 2-like [Homarus americanus]|uniref:basic salivary proline-rich protein 2-like n=1 Tax=Homarus americanus TaxID=6706 RepID=UPI001C489191|nr:basic salivary proline-rich protein 2-like [Homarus americanus]